MKLNKILFITVSVIVISFLGIFIFSPKKDFSEVENRYLQEFDINELDKYMSDHFPFRSGLVKIKNKVEVLMGKNLINGIYVGSDDYLIPKMVTSENRDYLIKSINNFSKDHEVDVLIAPDSIAVNDDKINNKLSDSQKEEIEYIYSELKYSNNYNIIDCLKKHNKENQMYYKTDHHWTSYGAFYAYQEYLSKKGMESISIDEFEVKKVSDDFLGTSSSLALGLAKKEDMYILDKDVDVEVNYVYEEIKTNSLYNYDYLNKKDKYAMFLDNNHGLITIKNNDINDGSNLLLIKNSYANSFVPFIINHYENVHVIDLRYFGDSISKYVEDNKMDNILILYNLNNFYSDKSIIRLK